MADLVYIPKVMHVTAERDTGWMYLGSIGTTIKTTTDYYDTYEEAAKKAETFIEEFVASFRTERIDRPESELQKAQQVTRVPIPDLNVSYTGFMQMGDKKFAIINGIEYTSGDRLEQGDYIVRSITPRQVVIVSTGSSKKKFIFPLEE